MTNTPSTTSRGRISQVSHLALRVTGFTLVEVATTIGVIAIGVLPLFTLLALATDEHSNANHESIAAIIAQGVFTDLRRSGSELGGLLYRHQDLYDSAVPTSDPNLDFKVAPLTSPQGAINILYGEDADTSVIEDWGYAPIKEASLSDYSSGSTHPGATHLIRIEYTQNTTGIAHENLDGTNAAAEVYQPKLYTVVISVEYPALAAQANRKAIQFETYMTLDQYD